jgi:hypothetical protein
MARPLLTEVVFVYVGRKQCINSCESETSVGWTKNAGVVDSVHIGCNALRDEFGEKILKTIVGTKDTVKVCGDMQRRNIKKHL